MFSLLSHGNPARDSLPGFIRAIDEIRGVRVVRLQGSVGKEIGAQADAADKAAARTNAFARPLLFDFAGTEGWDFSTVSYLVLALRRRMASHAQVGIINPPPTLIAELEMARVGTLFRVFPSEEDALNELSRPWPGTLPTDKQSHHGDGGSAEG